MDRRERVPGVDHVVDEQHAIAEPGFVIVMCSAITSSPRIVPPSDVYECVDRMASG